jgi:hypothetical protein
MLRWLAAAPPGTDCPVNDTLDLIGRSPGRTLPTLTRSTTMESLQQTATRMLGPLLDAQPLTSGKVRFAWQIVAGPAMSRATRVDWTATGGLRISASDATWRREVERARPLLASRLRKLLGPEAVRQISITE